jgi:hypothetical protein
MNLCGTILMVLASAGTAMLLIALLLWMGP